MRAVVADPNSVAAAAVALERCFRTGGKLLAFGNGGSAAEAQHLAADLVGKFKLERPPLPAIALTADSSVVSALSNDRGFDQVFARQVGALGRSGDVAYAISTSGASENVLAGVRAATANGLRTICSVGATRSELEHIVDVPIVVGGSCTPDIQERQLVVDHLLCELVEEALFGSAAAPWCLASGPSASEKVVDWPTLISLREGWRAQRKTVAWTNGCFDLLHVGHLRSLESARALGDVLVVGVNDDRSVRELKGPGRPFVPASERAELVAGIGAVDHVLVFSEPTPEVALERLRPEVHVKGADYADQPLPECSTVEAYGGLVRLLPLVPGRSSTALARRIGQESAPSNGRRAVFVDRDGTLVEDVGYLSDPAQLRFVSGAIKALGGLRDRGFLLVVVSNQSGIARGLLTSEQATKVHEHFVTELARHEIILDDVRYCHHGVDDRCACRKPNPGMVLDAARDLGIDLEASVLIGDKESDVDAGRAAGIGTTILLGSNNSHPDAARDWDEALRKVDELVCDSA